ncbi:MAG TPA: hypothetical protein PK335_06805 [Draconibacterium sp.]|nr:hypothetical protein [Draconibacterium sp.]
MNILAVLGAFIMTMAFLSYGIGSVTLERFRIVGIVVLLFYLLGLMFEVIAIGFMASSGSGRMGSWHVILGIIAFLLMLVNTIWVWVVYFKKGFDGQVSMTLLKYTKAAFLLWVISYLLGIATIIWF